MKNLKDLIKIPFPSQFTDKELHVIGHAIGFNPYKVYHRNGTSYFAPYHNYYYTGENDETWNGLVDKGFAIKTPAKDNMAYFSVSKSGLFALQSETTIHFYSKNARGNEVDASDDVIEVLLDHAVYCGYGCWIPPGARTISHSALLPYKLTLATLNYLKEKGYVAHYYEGGIDDEGFPHCTHGWVLTKKWKDENKERYDARQEEEYRRMDEIEKQVRKEMEVGT